MSINRRRAPKSEVSRKKKLDGHAGELEYAGLIGGEVLPGVGKGDVKDRQGFLHSLKSGKKWQLFLYNEERIRRSRSLGLLAPCLESFAWDKKEYFKHREKCIAFKETNQRERGKAMAQKLTNTEVKKAIGRNVYVLSKERLAFATSGVCEKLRDKKQLRRFLDEAIFNAGEVDFLVVRDTHLLGDKVFKVFPRDIVLDVFTSALAPSVSNAGRVAVDYNVPGQKVLLRYDNESNPVNVIEIEVRNDEKHYRLIRCNMMSKYALALLLNGLGVRRCDCVTIYGVGP
jgi:uncharacterized C2H2 Zn-finger protein